ncbi:uncharacterized protein TNCV_4606411 [Trichonephila clavipes]|nr:uncharacterized protein TNCV_4606411 [Trichonephila clavipes]
MIVVRNISSGAERNIWRFVACSRLIEQQTLKSWFGSIRRRKKGCGSPVVKVSDHGRHVMSSSPVPLKTRRVGQRCTLNLSRAETSSRWCDVVV